MGIKPTYITNQSENLQKNKIISGGIWANGASNGLSVTIAVGSLSGMKLVVMLNGVTIATYDNCATATDIK